MIRQKTKSRKADIFLELVKAFPLKPIRTTREHAAASRTIRRLVGSKPEDQFTPGERDYLEALTILVRDYQQKRDAGAREGSTPNEILRHLMAENDMSVTDLGKVIGSRTAASMILNGRRYPSKAHILRLADRFKINPSLLFGEWLAER